MIEDRHKDRVRDLVNKKGHSIIDNKLAENGGMHVLFDNAPVGFGDELGDAELREFLNQVFIIIDSVYELPEKAKEYVSYA